MIDVFVVEKVVIVILKGGETRIHAHETNVHICIWSQCNQNLFPNISITDRSV